MLGQMGCACGARSGEVCDCAFSKTARAFLAPNFGQIFVSCEFLGFLKNGCYSSVYNFRLHLQYQKSYVCLHVLENSLQKLAKPCFQQTLATC